MKNDNRLLEGKRVVVTTGARGIGKEIALLFASQEAVVAVGGKNVPCPVSYTHLDVYKRQDL